MDTPILEKARQRVALGELDEVDNWSLDFAREVVRLRGLIQQLDDALGEDVQNVADRICREAVVDEGQLEHGPVLTKEMVREYLAAERDVVNIGAFDETTAKKMLARLESSRKTLREAVR